MRDGRIVQAAPPEELYSAPADRWTAGFVGAGNFLPGLIEGDLVETLLGRFPVVGRNGSSRVDVLIRPELLELRPDPNGPAEVVGREFRGHDVFYRVRLADGTVVVSQRPSTELVPNGSRVVVSPHREPVRVFS
jgi:ABC-type Fe3+/spermidine/putrescine transport system ATPase subunit